MNSIPYLWFLLPNTTYDDEFTRFLAWPIHFCPVQIHELLKTRWPQHRPSEPNVAQHRPQHCSKVKLAILGSPKNTVFWDIPMCKISGQRLHWADLHWLHWGATRRSKKETWFWSVSSPASHGPETERAGVIRGRISRSDVGPCLTENFEKHLVILMSFFKFSTTQAGLIHVPKRISVKTNRGETYW